MATEKTDSLPIAIAKVINDWTIDDKTKLERIEAYIEVYFDDKKQTMVDMAY